MKNGPHQILQAFLPTRKFALWLCHLLLLVGVLAVTAPQARCDTFGYDDSGRLRSSSQTNGLSHTFDPDEENNLLSVTHGGTDTTDTNGAGNGIQDWWENYYFGARDTNPLATPAGDGISSLMKFAFGQNPLVASTGPQVTASYQNYNGQNYVYLTYVRSKEAASLLYPEQSSNGTSWFSGSGYFAQVSVTDLGDGTEQVVMRCLTPLPGASSLSFRLKAAGVSQSAYYTIPAAPAVPALPLWALAALLIALPLLAARSLRSRPSAA